MQYFRYRSLFSGDDLARLFSGTFIERADVDAPCQWFCDLYEGGEWPDEVARAQNHDLLTYLPDDLLVKSDRASMACSLELRAPMLAREVVELGLSLPTEWKIRGKTGKWLLRRAFSDVLSPEVLAGPKRGFGVPLARWLREDLAGTLKPALMEGKLAELGWFRPESLAGLANDHLSGRDDHSHRLWALLVLSRWVDKHM